MKLFQMVFENEYNDLSDEELILLNRANTLSGIPYFALQKVLSKRGLTTYRIIEIEQNAFNKDNKWLNIKEKYKKMLLHLGSYRDLFPIRLTHQSSNIAAWALPFSSSTK